jgi:Lar family restriction alleviation protein
MNEMKPCPFCGGEPMIKLSIDNPPQYKIYHACKKEGQSADIIINTNWYKSAIKAIEKWNERME